MKVNVVLEPAVWADLTLIFGVRSCDSAWNIATETESGGLKKAICKGYGIACFEITLSTALR